jgi:uncharacterized membrane protein
MTTMTSEASEPADPEIERAGADRMVFFSDAVIAIAITLLAIDLPAPVGDGAHGFLAALAEHRIDYVTFLISFVVIGMSWASHHRTLRYLRSTDPALLTLNLAWLLLIVVNPLLTRTLRLNTGVAPFALYAVAQVVQLVILAVLVRHAGRRGLFAPGAPPTERLSQWASAIVHGAPGFLLSVPAFLTIGRSAWLVWIVTPLVIGQIVNLRGRERGG